MRFGSDAPHARAYSDFLPEPGPGAGPKRAGPSRHKSRGFRLKGLVWRAFSHAFRFEITFFNENALLLTCFSLCVQAFRFEAEKKQNRRNV